jgi:hypothetical protein
MTFGKRAGSGQPSTRLTSGDTSVRLSALRGEMRRIMREAETLARLTAAKPAGGPAKAALFVAQPISIKDFNRHFAFELDGRIRRCSYAFASADGTITGHAQMHLLELTRAISVVGSACSGHSESAIRDMLRRPGLREEIDRIIALSAYFVAFFDNMVYAHDAKHGTPEQRALGIDLQRMERNLLQWLATARALALAPERLESHLPRAQWPALGAEIILDDDPTPCIVYEVYLPPELADAAHDGALVRPVAAAAR